MREIWPDRAYDAVVTRLFMLALLVPAVGCGADTVSLAVELQTDLVPGTDFEGATVELREGSDPNGPESTPRRRAPSAAR